MGNCTRRLIAEIAFKLDYLHQEGMPDRFLAADRTLALLAKLGIIGQHKYLPYRHWFRHELARHVRDVMTDPLTSARGYWNHQALESIARDHIEGRRNYSKEIGVVLTVESVARVILSGSTASRMPVLGSGAFTS